VPVTSASVRADAAQRFVSGNRPDPPAELVAAFAAQPVGVG
jgi:hypothetical protein